MKFLRFLWATLKFLRTVLFRTREGKNLLFLTGSIIFISSPYWIEYPVLYIYNDLFSSPADNFSAIYADLESIFKDDNSWSSLSSQKYQEALDVKQKEQNLLGIPKEVIAIVFYLLVAFYFY